jgi:uncharacterized phage-associated protein
MGYSAKAVANAFLQIAANHEAALSPLKLQKLVYIAHGWHLAIQGDILVSDEFAEAWQYGPVFPSLYHEFKSAGKGAITKRATEFEIAEGPELDVLIVEPTVPSEDQATWDLLAKVWDVYGKFSGLALSDITHQPNTPWQETWSQNGGRRNADIDNDLIKRHYQHLAATRKAA